MLPVVIENKFHFHTMVVFNRRLLCLLLICCGAEVSATIRPLWKKVQVPKAEFTMSAVAEKEVHTQVTHEYQCIEQYFQLS